jgi:hypothetical protein
MKKNILPLALGLLLHGPSHAQDEKTYIKDDLESVVQQQKELKVEKKADRKALHELQEGGTSDFFEEAFYSDFGNIPDVSWSQNGVYQVASFQKDGQPTKAYFDFNSNLIGTSEDKSFSDIPVKAQDFFL